MSVLANPNNPNAHPLPHPGRTTEVIEAPGEHLLGSLDHPQVNPVEVEGNYRAVNISARQPLLSATEVNRQIPGAGEHFGHLLAVVDEPHPNHLGRDSQTRRMAAQANRVYVFGRIEQNGPLYTLMGTGALGGFEQGMRQGDSTVVTLRHGGDELVVGRKNWLPSVGYDTSLLEHDPDLKAAASTVSSEQGRFTVDENGDLHYAETATRKNPAEIRMHKTQAELQADKAYGHKLDDEYARLREQRRATNNDRTELQRGTIYETPNVTDDEVTITPEDNLVRKMKTRTFGGRLVGEQYKGQRRKASFLGRIATRLFG